MASAWGRVVTSRHTHPTPFAMASEGRWWRSGQCRGGSWPATAQFPAEGRSTAQQVMNHLSVDNRQDGAELPDLLVGHSGRIEIVVAQYDHVAEFAFFDRAKLILFPEEPAVCNGIETECLLTRNLLTGIDHFSRNVLSSDHVVDHVPRVQRRDLGGVRSGADTNAAIDDHAQRRA